MGEGATNGELHWWRAEHLTGCNSLSRGILGEHCIIVEREQARDMNCRMIQLEAKNGFIDGPNLDVRRQFIFNMSALSTRNWSPGEAT